MFPEFDSVSLLMSTSEPLLLQNNEKSEEIDFGVLIRQTTLSGPQHSHSGQPRRQAEAGEESDVDVTAPDAENLLTDRNSPPGPVMGELKATDEEVLEDNVINNEDGFRTPTSLEHRISVAKDCPLAPTKPRAVRQAKRRATPPSPRSDGRRSLQMDLSPEAVESLFFHRNTKKARKEDAS